jgi:hypothetical protein
LWYRADGDRDNCATNGNAANTGHAVVQIQTATHHCIEKLRILSDQTYTQFSAMGKEGENKFETVYKHKLMPEYAIPLAFHLLSHRRETPDALDSPPNDEFDHEEEIEKDDIKSNDEDHFVITKEGQMKQLKKRLILLLKPMVKSLGDGADNISFCIQMTQIIGKHYTPVDLSPVSSTKKQQSLGSKLKVVCTCARKVLMSMVKSDKNLTAFPGRINLPRSLFSRNDVGTLRLSIGEDTIGSASIASTVSKLPNLKTPSKSSSDKLPEQKATGETTLVPRNSRVHFSPDVKNPRAEQSPAPRKTKPSADKSRSPHSAKASTEQPSSSAEKSPRGLSFSSTSIPSPQASEPTIDGDAIATGSSKSFEDSPVPSSASTSQSVDTTEESLPTNRRGRKRGTSTASLKSKLGKKTKTTTKKMSIDDNRLPKQIRLKETKFRARGKSTMSKGVSMDEFDFDDGENEINRKSSIGKASPPARMGARALRHSRR